MLQFISVNRIGKNVVEGALQLWKLGELKQPLSRSKQEEVMMKFTTRISQLLLDRYEAKKISKTRKKKQKISIADSSSSSSSVPLFPPIEWQYTIPLPSVLPPSSSSVSSSPTKLTTESLPTLSQSEVSFTSSPNPGSTFITSCFDTLPMNFVLYSCVQHWLNRVNLTLQLFHHPRLVYSHRVNTRINKNIHLPLMAVRGIGNVPERK